MRVIHTQSIRDEAEIGAARRAVHRYAELLGFSETELSELDIVVQEIGTNAARYATGGGCLHWTLPLGEETYGLELLYCDKGPGIYDIDSAVHDGVSTSGSLGVGLGAIRRMLDEFDVYSTVRATSRLLRSRRTTHGTAIWGRKWIAARGKGERSVTEEWGARAGVWSRPRPREDVNGDAYFMKHVGSQMLFAAVDGLGHGPGAHEAARVAVETLSEWKGEALSEVFFEVHGALRATRGAVMGACVIDEAAERLHYAGVGNVEARFYGAPQPIRPVPNNGTLGLRLTGVRVYEHAWARGTTLFLATDGVSASWDVQVYPGLLTKSPQLIAAIIARDFARESDDATVLVAR